MSLLRCKRCGMTFPAKALACPGCGAKVPQKEKFSVIHGLGIFVGLLIVFVLIIQDPKPEPKATVPVERPAPTESPSYRSIALSNVKLNTTWRSPYGVVMEADFTITNPNPFAVYDITITCECFGKSGTKIRENTRTVYDIVMPETTKKITDFNMGFTSDQADKARCFIVDLKTGE